MLSGPLLGPSGDVGTLWGARSPVLGGESGTGLRPSASVRRGKLMRRGDGEEEEEEVEERG